uniref:Uncharacterized protein n=1 Tax=Knipowitschia caucasica TaxID=637954 RepID=A0AAV2M799_KNICA
MYERCVAHSSIIQSLCLRANDPSSSATVMSPRQEVSHEGGLQDMFQQVQRQAYIRDECCRSHSDGLERGVYPSAASPSERCHVPDWDVNHRESKGSHGLSTVRDTF